MAQIDVPLSRSGFGETRRVFLFPAGDLRMSANPVTLRQNVLVTSF